MFVRQQSSKKLKRETPEQAEVYAADTLAHENRRQLNTYFNFHMYVSAENTIKSLLQVY